MWDVLKALRAHDEELGEQLDELRRAMATKGSRLVLPGKIHVDIPERVNAAFAKAFDIRLVEQTTSSWEFWFGLLAKFVKDRGDARVPYLYTVDGYRLGGWVKEQRISYIEGILHTERRRRLEEMPGWSWHPHSDDWEEGFGQLQSYIEHYGHAHVPQSFAVDGFRLGRWVMKQRGRTPKGDWKQIATPAGELPGWTWDPRSRQVGERIQSTYPVCRALRPRPRPTDLKCRWLQARRMGDETTQQMRGRHPGRRSPTSA